MQKNKRIKLGMIGGGNNSFIGILHRVAAYMCDDYDFIGGVFSSNHQASLEFAEQMDMDTSRVYENVEAFVVGESKLPKSERIEAVIIVTPNVSHHAIAKSLIEAGFHIICEKPVTVTLEEAQDLERLINENNIVFSLTHTYTGYPMVRQMKWMISQGLIGDIQKVDAQYYQGWINPVIHEAEKRKDVWRLNPKVAGISSCMGDIGVHAFNMIEYTTGLQVTSVLADLHTLYDDNPLDIDGTVLLRINKDIRGIVRASQIATGEENNIQISVYGSKGGLKWEQENPNYLYLYKDDEPMQVLKPGHAYNSAFAADSTKMAPGHPEGIFDSMGNIYKGTARAIRGEKYEEGAFPTIHDGLRGMTFIEKVVESSKAGNVWLDM